jgi:hypothetical protein
MVRMLFDPRFAEQALRDPRRALSDAELTDEEIAWLRAPDPRAWRVDPERPDRALTVLVQEYPASLALAAASVGWRSCADSSPPRASIERSRIAARWPSPSAPT